MQCSQTSLMEALWIGVIDVTDQEGELPAAKVYHHYTAHHSQLSAKGRVSESLIQSLVHLILILLPP